MYSRSSRPDVVLPLLHHATGALVAETVVAEQVGIVAEVTAIRESADALGDHAYASAIRLGQRPVRRRKTVEIGRQGKPLYTIASPRARRSTAWWRLKRGTRGTFGRRLQRARPAWRDTLTDSAEFVKRISPRPGRSIPTMSACFGTAFQVLCKRTNSVVDGCVRGEIVTAARSDPASKDTA